MQLRMDGVSGGQGPPQLRLGEARRQGRKDPAPAFLIADSLDGARHRSSSAPVKCGAKAARASIRSDVIDGKDIGQAAGQHLLPSFAHQLWRQSSQSRA